MDREIFSCLVIKLGRSPSQSLLVMALWLWLEYIGYPNLVSKLIDLPRILINLVAQEAVSCLNCLEFDDFHIPYNGVLTLTSALMQKEISLQLFKLKKFTAIAGIKNVLNKICARIFKDILLRILGSPYMGKLLPYAYRPVIVPGFPHRLFGDFNSPPTNFVQLDLSDPRIWNKNRLFDDVLDGEKTIFLTFSRGFPVTEEEVKFVFTSTFGINCIKNLQMGNKGLRDQTLFATMVVNDVETLDRILNGKHIAKFRINGKHIWARKYERRE
uniref:Uncharacterized protein LOC101502252 n=2 Tax=Cicer arietinum TaxID=3827 RepID=A0A1S2YA58_CICAR|nr:uncharacterized protein LOC101502252 [Cicer arietinum]